MADLETGNPFGVMNSNGNNRSGAYTNSNLATVAAMKTRLQEVDSGLYTDSKLNNMTYNDLVYAVRLADDPEMIK